jgi:hypothetical protein
LASDELAPYRDDLLIALQQGTIIATGRRWIEKEPGDSDPECGWPARTPIPADTWYCTLKWEEAWLNERDVRGYNWYERIYWTDIWVPRKEIESKFFVDQSSSPHTSARGRPGPKPKEAWKPVLEEAFRFALQYMVRHERVPADTVVIEHLSGYIAKKWPEPPFDESTIRKHISRLYDQRPARTSS